MAILIEGDCASLVDINSPNIRTERATHSIPYVLAGATDVIELRLTSLDEAMKALREAWSSDRALHLALILLDTSEDIDTQQQSVEVLRDLWSSPKVADFVRNWLYSAPLPENPEITNTRNIGSLFPPLAQLVQEVQVARPHIMAARTAWSTISEKFFTEMSERLQFERKLISAGCFWVIVDALRHPDQFGYASIQCYQLLQTVPNSRIILDSWLKELRPAQAMGSHKTRFTQVNKETRGDPARKPTTRFIGRAAFEDVQKQKEAILPFLRRGSIEKVRKYIERLIASQLSGERPELAAKSLCDLAQRAKEVNNYSLQLELAKWAAELEPQDAWAHGQVADAFYCLGQYDNAVKYLQLAAQLGDSSFAAGGQARILRSQGRLEDALAAFQKQIREFPGDLHGWLGRAEIFRDMWRLDHALDSYNVAIDRFPGESVPRCGKANVLKLMGRLDEALEYYTRTCEQFPDVVVPAAGRADVLKEMGRLDDALEGYEAAIREFPDDSVPRSGRADVLKEMGRLDDALRAYDDTIRDFPFAAVPYTGKADVLAEMGRLGTAHAAFDEAARLFPSESRSRSGKASVYRKEGKLVDALQILDQVVARFPYDLFSKKSRADVLKELGHFEDALKAYDEVIAIAPYRNGPSISKAAILVVLGRYAEAEGYLPSNVPRTRDEWVGYHIRGMMLLRSGKYDEAVELFQTGLISNPFANHRPYFEGALAVATLQRQRYEDALRYLGENEEPITDIIRMHACGALNRFEEAKKAYSRVELRCPQSLVPLRNEIAVLYKFRQGAPSHHAQWIFEQECRGILLRAA